MTLSFCAISVVVTYSILTVLVPSAHFVSLILAVKFGLTFSP